MPRGRSVLALLFRATSSAVRRHHHPCASPVALHPPLLKSGRASLPHIATALAVAYAGTGHLPHARRVFDETPRKDLVLCNAMVACYAAHGLALHAWSLFASMRRSCPDLAGDGFTFSALLRPPRQVGNADDAEFLLRLGALAHGLVLRLGHLADVVVATALLDMYAKYGRVTEARRVFNAMVVRNVVSWNAIIVCYGWHAESKGAVDLFRQMLRDGCCCPDERTLVSVLSSCANMAAANEATQVHSYAQKRGLQGILQVANALIMAYDGLRYFLMMKRGYLIDPSPEHLACLVDLLGRAGRIEDDYNVVVKLSSESNTDIVGAFLGACKVRGNIELAKWAADKLLCLEPSEAVNYLLMSNAFAAAGAWNELAKVLTEMTDVGVNRSVEYLAALLCVPARADSYRKNPKRKDCSDLLRVLARQAHHLLGIINGVARGQLQVGFYSDSCPDAEDTVTAASAPSILPALLRLQFHDCFVRGCDASVLIRSASNDAEVDNAKNQGLRGQDVVDAAKAQLEDQCPGVVSCADIIALAARDAVAMTGGPSFDVPTGRRDGLASNLRDADVLPDAADSISVLRSRFAAAGLNDRDLVLLTAAHTVGTTACFFVKDRLYGFPLPGGNGKTGSDPSIPAAFLAELKARCPPGDFNTRLPPDRGSGTAFDDSILRNIRSGLAVIASDAVLAGSNATRALVDAYLGPAAGSFRGDFAAAMVRMGSIGAITGDDDAGEVRDVCSAFNSN
ncbi:peroxidase 43 [Panicum miliaceum]|uniref:peroxidase n=1 Tax=Panicum miliaceum TaxID=4540 RepID=A0A3L6T3R5_PANMI|nr:peroxidase 43 [Panicum miliaceum]